MRPVVSYVGLGQRASQHLARDWLRASPGIIRPYKAAHRLRKGLVRPLRPYEALGKPL